MILLDTSVLIEFFRRKYKENSFFYQLAQKHQSFAISAITRMEILAGVNQQQIDFWDTFFQKIEVLPFNTECANQSALLIKQLKATNQLLEIPDIMIAGTAIAKQLPLATLNVKHFARMQGVLLITPQEI
jgi:tRNA(fMet)-specific endonuclease VapC